METQNAVPKSPKVIVSAEQIQRRVRDIARQISDDYTGKTIYAVCVLENAFIFMADLVRSLEVPVVCQFVKPYFREKLERNIETTEIFYSPEVDVHGADVLLIEGILQSGITTEFLMRNFLTRGAASVKIAALLDKHSSRRVSLQPDYFGFLIEETPVMGYGLGDPDLNRNLPHVIAGGVLGGE